MNSNLNLVSGIAKYSVSTWMNLFLGFFSVIITTRLLSPEIYGLVSLFFSATSVMIYMLSLGLDGALIRFYNDPPGSDTRNQLLYKNLVLTASVSFFVGVVFAIFIGRSVSNFVFGIPSRLLIGVLFIYTFCQLSLRMLNISFRMSFQTRKYTVQNILSNSLSRILLIFAAFFTASFVGIVSILSIGMLLVLFVYLYFQKKEFYPKDINGHARFSINLKGYGEYFRFALFCAPTYIITYLNTYVNQQLISSVISHYALGIFSSTAMFVHIFSAIKGGFSTYWSAFVYKNYITEQKKITRVHDYLIVLTIAILSIFVFSRDLIYLVIGTDFHHSKSFFSLLLILPTLSFIMETTDKGIALAKKNQINLITHIVSVFANIGLCLLLIKPLGLMGAAIANAVSGIILYSLNTYWGQKYYHSIKSYRKSIVGIILMILILVIPSITLNMIYIVCSVLLLDLITLLAYKKEAYYIIKRFTVFFKTRKNNK
ncbi:MAG: oligosaccharide flippase family protein [Bacteroidales bacterium]|nr:oligosaccharide flippase family protein [Bacteroidales bacterium]